MPSIEAGEAITLTDAATAYRLDPPRLRELAEAGVVRAELLPRAGQRHDGYLFNVRELKQDLAPFRCRHPDCDRVALGPSRACKAHVRAVAKQAAAQGHNWRCEECGATKYYSPSHPGRSLCQPCYLESDAFRRAHLKAREAAASYREELARKLNELKVSRDLLDAAEVAEQLGVTSRSAAADWYIEAGLESEAHQIRRRHRLSLSEGERRALQARLGADGRRSPCAVVRSGEGAFRTPRPRRHRPARSGARPSRGRPRGARASPSQTSSSATSLQAGPQEGRRPAGAPSRVGGVLRRPRGLPRADRVCRRRRWRPRHGLGDRPHDRERGLQPLPGPLA